ncbi:MAG: DNA polymerase III subunit beta [Candidatus Pacebacteria bacterium]|nr:DNA polymerase III subunit beta [Candidatus Paceibacterota bacterium]
MKVTCVREKIQERISQAEKLAGKNVGLPILGALLLKAEKDTIVIRATNLDVGAEFRVPAKVKEKGEVAIPAGIASSIFSSLFSGKNIDLEVVNNNLVVSTEKNTTLIKSIKGDEFPTIPHIKEGVSFTLPAKNIATGVKSVWYASAVSDIKPEISSVYMYHKGADIVFVATDSFRLAEKKVKDSGVCEFEGVIIPVKNIREIIRIIENISGNCEVLFDKNQITFATEDVFLTSRIVNGVYPDYHQIIPKEFSSQVTVLKDDITNALKLTNIFADKFNKVNIKADAGRNVFEISSRNNDTGENMTTVDAVIKGDSFDVNFNYKYILDGFQSIHQDSVILKYDAKREVLIMQGVSDASFVYLVKPMNK